MTTVSAELATQAALCPQDVGKRERESCPSSLEIARFCLDDLDPESREAIELHLQECSHCLVEVESIFDSIRRTAPASRSRTELD
jgi:hypothetical protein